MQVQAKLVNNFAESHNVAVAGGGRPPCAGAAAGAVIVGAAQ